MGNMFRQLEDKLTPQKETEPAKPSTAGADEHAVSWINRVGTLPDPVRPVHLRFDEHPPQNLFAPHEMQGAMERREVYWTALRGKASEVQTNHRQMHVAVIGYRQASRDPNLGALGVFPSGKAADASQLIGEQRVPERDGASIDGLFTKENEVRRSASQRADEQIVAASIRSGSARVDEDNREVGEADTRLEIARKSRDRAISKLETLHRDVESAALELGAFEEDEDVAAQRDEIARLQEDAEELKEDIERASQVLALGFHIGEGALGDSAEKLGDVVAGVAAHKNDGRITDAKKTLRNAHEIGSRFEARRLENSLQSARSALALGRAEIETTRLEIRLALSAKRSAYARLGHTVAGAGPISAESQHNIAGLIAAIPLAQEALERTLQLERESVVPERDAAAESGLGIAASHGDPTAREFLRACTEIQSARHEARREQEKWMKRLNSMMALKQRTVGKVAGE